jgi:hypothetical protein
MTTWQVRGKKVLVLDPKLSGPLGLIIEVAVLREHGVEKIVYVGPTLKFDRDRDRDTKNVIWIVRSKYVWRIWTCNRFMIRIQYMKWIGETIRGHISEKDKKEYNLFFVPRRTVVSEKILEEEGVYKGRDIGKILMT